ncbi:PAS domain-containing protein [Desulfoscipio gibsoniae]
MREEISNTDFTFLDKLDINAYVIDKNLNLLHINKKAAQKYKNTEQLLGKSILGCHKNKNSKEKITTILNEFSAGRREPFNYSFKKGSKMHYKVIIPFYEDNTFKGIIEFSYLVNA